MIRELFHVGPLSISPFGVLMALAFIAAWAQLNWGLKRLEAGDEEDASALLLAAGIGGIVGGKLYYAILYADWRLVFSRFGLVWYGALLLGAVAVVWTIRSRRMPAWRAADAASAGMALGYAIGRVGCFLVGDDYGRPTELPWGVAFPEGLPGPTTAGFLQREYGYAIQPGVAADELVRVHPTQLYETLAALLIWGLAVAWIRGRRRPPGAIVLPVVGLLAAERLAVEMLRAKDDRFLGPFTVAQALSVAVIAIVALLWLRLRRRGEGRSDR